MGVIILSLRLGYVKCSADLFVQRSVRSSRAYAPPVM